MAVAKRPGRESPRKQNTGSPEDRVRTLGETNSTPGWPSLHRTGPEREKKKKKKIYIYIYIYIYI